MKTWQLFSIGLLGLLSWVAAVTFMICAIWGYYEYAEVAGKVFVTLIIFLVSVVWLLQSIEYSKKDKDDAG